MLSSFHCLTLSSLGLASQRESLPAPGLQAHTGQTAAERQPPNSRTLSGELIPRQQSESSAETTPLLSNSAQQAISLSETSVPKQTPQVDTLARNGPNADTIEIPENQEEVGQAASTSAVAAPELGTHPQTVTVEDPDSTGQVSEPSAGVRRLGDTEQIPVPIKIESNVDELSSGEGGLKLEVRCTRQVMGSFFDVRAFCTCSSAALDPVLMRSADGAYYRMP